MGTVQVQCVIRTKLLRSNCISEQLDSENTPKQWVNSDKQNQAIPNLNTSERR